MTSDDQNADLLLGESLCQKCSLKYQVKLSEVDKSLIEGFTCGRCGYIIPFELLNIPGIQNIASQIYASSLGTHSINGRTLIRVGFQRTVTCRHLLSWPNVPEKIFDVFARPIHSPLTTCTTYTGYGSGDIAAFSIGDGCDDGGTEGKALEEGPLPYIKVVDKEVAENDKFRNIQFKIISSWPEPYCGSDWPHLYDGQREFEDYLLGNSWTKGVPVDKWFDYKKDIINDYISKDFQRLNRFVLVEWSVLYFTEDSDEAIWRAPWWAIHFEALRKRIKHEYILAH